MSLKKLEQLKQKPHSLIGQAGKIKMNIKVNNERPGSAFKLPSSKFHIIPSTSRTNLPIRMNNDQRLTKSLQRSYSIVIYPTKEHKLVYPIPHKYVGHYCEGGNKAD